MLLTTITLVFFGIAKDACKGTTGIVACSAWDNPNMKLSPENTFLRHDRLNGYYDTKASGNDRYSRSDRISGTKEISGTPGFIGDSRLSRVRAPTTLSSYTHVGKKDRDYSKFAILSNLTTVRHLVAEFRTNNKQEKGRFRLEEFYQFPVTPLENCPPPGAERPNPGSIFYRLAQFNGSGKKIKEASSHTRYHRTGIYEDCSDLALSVFTEARDAREELDNSNRRGGWCVVAVNIPADTDPKKLGKWEHSPSNGNSHHDWWPSSELSTLELNQMCTPFEFEGVL